jgi:hypothetical protein
MNRKQQLQFSLFPEYGIIAIMSCPTLLYLDSKKNAFFFFNISFGIIIVLFQVRMLCILYRGESGKLAGGFLLERRGILHPGYEPIWDSGEGVQFRDCPSQSGTAGKPTWNTSASMLRVWLRLV